MPAQVAWNTYRIEGDTAYIVMRGGYEAIIDAVDLPRARKINWTARVRERPNKRTGIYVHQVGHFDVHLHHFVTDAPRGQIVDHINCNPLDNHNVNLRFATNFENMQNRDGANRNNKVGVRGVCRFRVGNKVYWLAKVNLPPNHPSGKKSVAKCFPETDVGFHQACEAVQQLRTEYMTHSDGR